MNIEEVRADIFRLFDIKVDKDDPIWAFLYANREILRQFQDVEDINRNNTQKHYEHLTATFDEFKTTTQYTISQSIEQFDFRIDEFNSNVKKLERLNENSISVSGRFKSDIQKSYDTKIEQLSELLNSNIIVIEERINSIIEAVDYTRFSKNIEREVDDVVRKSLQEVRAGVSINNRAMDNLKEINELNESTIRRLNNQVSTLTTIGVFQTLFFGFSIAFVGMIYFSQGDFKLPNFLEGENQEQACILTDNGAANE